eukprot:CAMPEP_0201581930 /NCGR_PEP_ID=MMETSP0190_2-20130828/77402_1 /ASSEMBLY_ACC=CAM_ASM_000263 /TAXON_ID=37353 /ORGANISM="Rosalina sp." /LENGTH=330 /DNA_ID=CAMNT_0048020863 /DNA_START=27 /DNA_END=1016 /DNA_ORIENTATION=+
MLSLLVLIGVIKFSASLGIRKSTYDLTQQEKHDLLEAIFLMKETPSSYNSSFSAYDYFAYVHSTESNPFKTYGHAQWSTFPWHRIFIHLFNLEMRKIANNPTLQLPYMEAPNPDAVNDLLSDETFLGGDGDLLPPFFISNTSALNCDDFQTYVQEDGLYPSCLSRSIGSGVPIDEDKYIMNSELPSKAEWDELITTYRPFDVPPYFSPNFTEEQHQSSFTSMADGCSSIRPDGKYSPFLKFAIDNLGGCPYMHGSIHWYVGGTLLSSSGPGDPLFFTLHSWVDLMWSRYQKRWGDDSFPEIKLDVDMMNNMFPGSLWLTANDCLDHEASM